MGPLEAPAWLLFDFVIRPVICGFCLWVPLAVSETFARIKSARLLQITDEEYDAMIFEGPDSIEQAYNRRYWTVLSVLLVAVIMPLYATNNVLISVRRFPAPLSWANANLFYFFIFWFPFNVILVYMVLMLVSKELVTILSLRRLFQEQELVLYSLHPDKSGGMRPLSDYVMTFNYLIATLGLALSVLIWSSYTAGTLSINYGLWLMILVYFVVSPLCFFAPLGTAHAAMKHIKEKRLLDIANQLQETYALAHKSLLMDNAEEFKAELKKIKQLRIMYELKEGSPEWPFDIGTVRKFGATMVPLMSTLLSIGLDLAARALGLW